MGLGQWLEYRLGLSGLKRAGQAYLDKRVPSHVNYAFTLGTAALALFATQVASGILLALNYSCSLASAHESVRRITYELPSGWLLRSFHAWSAHLMVLILFLHMTRVFWYGGYKSPRELTWLFGCGLLFATLAFGFTGYLLPMDQVAYWGTVVGTDPFFGLPGLGDHVGQMVRGGGRVTDATLSRFFIIHVLVLPGAVAALVGAHLYLVARLGISTRASVKVELERGHANLMQEQGEPFAKHMYREITTVIGVLSLSVVLAVLFPSELGEPFTADRTPKGVKPEWFFLPVYQLLKYFPKLTGILLANAGIVLLVLLPFLDRNPERAPSKRRFLLGVASAALFVTLFLGLLGFVSDRRFGSWEFDIRGVPHRVETK